MDVVRSNVEAIQGKIEVSTKAGQGTTMRIRLPLTLAIIDGMVVRVGNNRYVIPLSHIQESLLPGDCQLSHRVGYGEILLLRGVPISHYRLGKILAHSSEGDGPTIVIRSGSDACAVMVGNRIGEGKKEEAYETVRRVIILNVSLAWLVGLIVISLRGVITNWYDLTPAGVHNVRMLMLMMACVLWIRMINFSTFIGALRAGGDTRFALVMEICSIWLIGVPVALTAAFVFHWPVYYVYLAVGLEEIAKAFVSLWRFRSRKWIHDLVNEPAI
jgi:hypothetical protein